MIAGLQAEMRAAVCDFRHTGADFRLGRTLQKRSLRSGQIRTLTHVQPVLQGIGMVHVDPFTDKKRAFAGLERKIDLQILLLLRADLPQDALVMVSVLHQDQMIIPVNTLSVQLVEELKCPHCRLGNLSVGDKTKPFTIVVNLEYFGSSNKVTVRWVSGTPAVGANPGTATKVTADNPITVTGSSSTWSPVNLQLKDGDEVLLEGMSSAMNFYIWESTTTGYEPSGIFSASDKKNVVTENDKEFVVVNKCLVSSQCL